MRQNCLYNDYTQIIDFFELAANKGKFKGSNLKGRN